MFTVVMVGVIVFVFMMFLCINLLCSGFDYGSSFIAVDLGSDFM